MRIDVKELIASRDMAGHNEAHNAYFSKYEDWRTLAKQPFSFLPDTGATLSNLSAVIQISNLMPEVRVLDYGCGNGWLSKYLGYLGCRVTGVDVAQSAIDMANKTLSADTLSDPTRVNFKVIDGVTLPFEDETIERVICFSSFHHVADQRRTLSEFFRVLKPGGIVTFSEPSDGHSESEDSQFEMRMYGVIENEVRIEEIATWAAELGFDAPIMSFFQISPIRLPYDSFRVARQNGLIEAVGTAPFNGMLDLRCFTISKPGGKPDSRSRDGLDGALTVKRIKIEGDRIRWSARFNNTGRNVWLPSIPNAIGAVHIGYEVASKSGRIQISMTEIAPGHSGSLEFETQNLDGEFMFRLVAEHVLWFGEAVRI